MQSQGKIREQQNTQALQIELREMGFDLKDIRDAIKLTTDKQKIIENLVANQELNQMTKNAQDIMDLNNQKNQTHMKDQKQQNDDDFQSQQEQYKMVFLARMDVKLSLGKMAAQVATSALAAFKQIQSKIDKDQLSQIAYYQWQQSGQKKIVLKVNNEKQLLDLVEIINKQAINVYVNKSTKSDQLQIPEQTITVAAVGPAPEDILDKLTGYLKLF